MKRSQIPPHTSNPEARELIKRAQQRCRGCRRSWRLRGGRHGGPAGEECTAPLERELLRKIAREARERERGVSGAGATKAAPAPQA